jgi:hypothetical protein
VGGPPAPIAIPQWILTARTQNLVCVSKTQMTHVLATVFNSFTGTRNLLVTGKMTPIPPVTTEHRGIPNIPNVQLFPGIPWNKLLHSFTSCTRHTTTDNPDLRLRMIFLERTQSVI